MPDDVTPSPQASSASAAPRMSALAIVSVVLGVLSFLCIPIIPVIPAIVCGHLAWSRISKSGGALCGKGIAIVGLIVGYLAIPWAILQAWFLVSMFQGESHRLHDLAVEKKEIASDDNKLKVTTSGFWVKRTDLNKEAKLQAASPSEGMFIVVISESKSDFPSLSLEKHHQVMRDAKLRQMKNASATEVVSLVVDGQPALQDELRGTENDVDLVFLHTTVDEGEYFDHVMAWTVKSRWAAHKSELAEVTNSFHSEK